MRRLLACLFFWLAVWLASGCAYRYAHQQSAHRTEQETSTFQTAASAESQTQSVATKTEKGSRETRRFNPDGKLVEQVLEQWGSDGRVEVVTESASASTAEGGQFRSVVASSSSSSAVKAEAGTVSLWWWLAGAAALVVGVWALRRRIRSLIPFL